MQILLLLLYLPYWFLCLGVVGEFASWLHWLITFFPPNLVPHIHQFYELHAVLLNATSIWIWWNSSACNWAKGNCFWCDVRSIYVSLRHGKVHLHHVKVKDNFSQQHDPSTVQCLISTLEFTHTQLLETHSSRRQGLDTWPGPSPLGQPLEDMGHNNKN